VSSTNYLYWHIKHCTQDSRVIWQTYLISIDHLELCDPLTLTFLLFLPVLSLLLHLPINQRVIYKLSILTYKALHTGQPSYLADLLDLYRPSRALRSTNSHLLAVPSCSKSSFASRAFCVSSPNNWNSLPLNIRSSDSLATFQSRLKSYLFASVYHV